MTKTKEGYNYGEAFHLMQYKDDVTGEIEWVWNSRDGVTPFSMTSPAGNPAAHAHWESDKFAPNHTPAVGDRIWADMSKEGFQKLLEEKVERYWKHPDYPMSTMFETKEEALEQMMKTEWEKGMPYLVVVTEEMHIQFKGH